MLSFFSFCFSVIFVNRMDPSALAVSTITVLALRLSSSSTLSLQPGFNVFSFLIWRGVSIPFSQAVY